MIYENYEIAAKADELKQMFDNMELFLPRSYTQRFSEWNNLRDVVETVLDEYKDLCDEVDREKEERQEAEGARLEMIRGIRDIQADMDLWAGQFTDMEWMVIKALQKCEWYPENMDEIIRWTQLKGSKVYAG